MNPRRKAYFKQEAEKENIPLRAIPPEYVMATVLRLRRESAFYLKYEGFIKKFLFRKSELPSVAETRISESGK